VIFLSSLQLDPLSRQVQNELAVPYEMHRTLCHAFPDLNGDEWKLARVLFRVDDNNGRLQLLVQSKRKPDWHAFRTHLNGARYLLNEPKVKEWRPQLQEGDTLQFRLVENPTFRSKSDGSKQGQRIGLYREIERLDWLARQSERCGFSLPKVQMTFRRNTRSLVFRGRTYDELVLKLPTCQVIDLNDGHRHPSPNPKIQLSAARFEGVLNITNLNIFTQSLENGIGPAKGFGFGLLSIARTTSR
jgi:CRISPR system Cascade subunit CasE